MNNIPDVHANDRDIPAGKVWLAECGDPIVDEHAPVRIVLDTRRGWEGRHEVELVAVTAGFQCAGSMMRWDNGCFAVYWYIDGCRHGQRYRDFDSALAHFNRIPE